MSKNDFFYMYKLLVREKVILQRLQHPRVSSILRTCDPRTMSQCSPTSSSSYACAFNWLIGSIRYTDPYDADIVYLVLRDGGRSTNTSCTSVLLALSNIVFACTLQQLPNLLAAVGLPLSPEHALRIATDIIEGLSYIHHKGLMHRDLKPDNVAIALPMDTMLALSSLTTCQAAASSDASDYKVPCSVSLPSSSASASPTSSQMPSACLIDFGMARAFDVPDDHNDITTHMVDFGEESAADDHDSDDEQLFPVRAVSARVSIPLYCAPEIALSLGLYDSKVDMWAGMLRHSELRSNNHFTSVTFNQPAV